MCGLEPTLLIAKGALVMLTVNLWASVGLCNGSVGTVVDIVYQTNHQPPDLPIAVIVKFDHYIGPFLSNFPSSVLSLQYPLLFIQEILYMNDNKYLLNLHGPLQSIIKAKD